MSGRTRAPDDLYLELELLQRAQDQCREIEQRIWALVCARSRELATLLLEFWKGDEAAAARWLCTRRGELSPAEMVDRGRLREVIAQVKWASRSIYV